MHQQAHSTPRAIAPPDQPFGYEYHNTEAPTETLKIEHLSKQIIFRITAEPKNEALLIGRLQISKHLQPQLLTTQKAHIPKFFHTKMQINKSTSS